MIRTALETRPSAVPLTNAAPLATAVPAKAAVTLSAADRAVWALTALVACIVAGAVLFAGFDVAWESFRMPALAAAASLAGLWFYGVRRPDQRLASACHGTAQLVIFTGFGAPLSYIAATSVMPLRDHSFAALDAAIGFDWLALLRVMDGLQAFQPLFALAYASMLPQIAALMLLFALTGRRRDLSAFMLAFAIAVVITITASIFIPALGPWAHYAPLIGSDIGLVPATGVKHVPTMMGLRDGSLRLLMGTGTEGLIVLPSLHAASAVLLLHAGWKIPVARWGFLAVNLVMLASTFIEGSHYLVDVAAGVALAYVAMALARAIGRGQGPRRMDLAEG